MAKAKTSSNSESGKGANKSQAIRDALNSKRGIKPQEVVEILATQGIETTAAYVSTIKSNTKKKKNAGRKTAGPGRPPKTRSTGDSFSVETLLAAKKMAEKLGGVDQAKAALDAISRLNG